MVCSMVQFGLNESEAQIVSQLIKREMDRIIAEHTVLPLLIDAQKKITTGIVNAANERKIRDQHNPEGIPDASGV